MAEQESIQTQLDTLRYDMDELVKGSETQAENMRNLGMTLVREHTLLSRLVIQHETFVRDTVKALQLFQGAVNSQQQQFHLLRDTVASLQQDVATLEKMVGDHINDSTFDGAMKVRLQNLEDKFKLMEESTGIEYNPWYCDDETDEGGAERAEMERAAYERQQAHFSFGELKLIQGECVQCERVCMITPVGGYCEGCYYDNINAV